MTAPLVLDASVTINRLVEDEDEPIADAAFAALDHAPGIAPRVRDFEVRNVHLMLHRKGRFWDAEFRRLSHRSVPRPSPSTTIPTFPRLWRSPKSTA